MLPGITPLVGVADYNASAVAFDGTNDYLTRGADLTGVSDGKVGTFSGWFDFTGLDGSFQTIAVTSDAFGKLIIGKDTGNKVFIEGKNVAGTAILRLSGATSLTAAQGWHHIAAAWDLATTAGELFVDDADDAPTTLLTNDTIDYTEADFGIGGGVSTGNFKLHSQVADLYLNLAAFIDIGTEANRRKFVSSNVKPVFLGADGSIPTGSAPVVFLSGPTTTWHTNDGAGGGFTESGALTDASSSPSD